MTDKTVPALFSIRGVVFHGYTQSWGTSRANDCVFADDVEEADGRRENSSVVG